MKSFCLASLFVLVSATSAFAQLKLEIKDGLVSIDAKSVPARQILAEWARVGGTRVVGGEKVTGAPLTLKFANLPERQALDIILRNVAGYMAAPRRAAATPGASAYDRILILATTSAPATAAATPARGNTNTNATRMPNGRPMPPRPPNMQPPPEIETADAAEQAVEDQSDTGVQAPVFTFPSSATGQRRQSGVRAHGTQRPTRRRRTSDHAAAERQRSAHGLYLRAEWRTTARRTDRTDDDVWRDWRTRAGHDSTAAAARAGTAAAPAERVSTPGAST